MTPDTPIATPDDGTAAAGRWTTTVIHRDDRRAVDAAKAEGRYVYIGRRPGHKWGNPYVIGRSGDRAAVIARYRQRLLSRPDLLADLHELDGKVLGCHCKPEPCHGDVLVELELA